jgi:hypothetical protein
MTGPRETAAALVLGYETVALSSNGRLPTVTKLCNEHHWLGAAVVAALIIHLIARRPPVVIIVPAQENTRT